MSLSTVPGFKSLKQPHTELLWTSNFEKSILFNPLDFLTGEKNYIGSSFYTPEEYTEIIAAVASGMSWKIKPEELVAGHIPLERTHKDRFLELIHNTN